MDTTSLSWLSRFLQTLSTRRCTRLAWTSSLVMLALPVWLLLPRPLPAQTPAGGTTQEPPAGQTGTEAPAANDEDAKKRLTLEEEIVVTANRIPSPAETVGSSVTVIGQEEIERRNEPLVQELLRSVPGLDIAQSGPGGVSSVFIRGGSSNHTLVLVDGVRVNDTSGGYDFSALSADDVDRIEVLRGPQSTLYGSEAMAGVISVSTRRGRPGFHFDVDGNTGSLSTNALRVSADGGNARYDYSFSVADRRSEGVSVASERRGNSETDPYSDRTFAGRLGVALPGDGRLDLILRHVDADSSLDGFTFGVGPTDDPNYTQHRRFNIGSLQFAKPLTSWWDLKVKVGAHEEETQGKDPDTFFNNYDIQTYLVNVNAQSDIKLGKNDTLIVGVDSEHRKGETASAYNQSLQLDSAYVEDDWSWNDHLFLTAGARNDRYSRFGDKTTYRFTASYLVPHSGFKLHGSFGTGFRGPSFDELFFPFSGNVNLQPETSTGYDVGIDHSWRAGTVVAGVTYFSNRYKNLIDFNLDTFLFENELRAESEGVETSIEVKPRADLELRGTYTYNETRNLVTGLQLARRPRHRWTLLAAFDPNPRLRSTVSLVGVTGRIDSDGTRMDPYTRVDLGLDYEWRPAVQPFLQVENLLNKHYEEVTGYTTPGFRLNVGFRLHYK